MLPDYMLMAVEDESNFLLDNLDYIVDPNSALKFYYVHRALLYIMLSLYLFFKVCMTIYMERNKEVIIL